MSVKSLPTPQRPIGAILRLRLIPGLLLLAGSLLILLQSEVPIKLAHSLLGWTSGVWPPQAVETSPIDEALRRGYTLLSLRQPLLPWLLWLVGAVWLLIGYAARGKVGAVQSEAVVVKPAAGLKGFGGVKRERVNITPNPSPTRRGALGALSTGGYYRSGVLNSSQYPEDLPPDQPSASHPSPTRRGAGGEVNAPSHAADGWQFAPTLRRILVVSVLLVICGLGATTRAANLLPDQYGIWPESNFDEQVYYTNAKLLTQGELPYRDHFLAHPPGASYIFALAMAAQAPWGGPGAFGAARQWLMLLSLLAVPLVFLCGRRMGGSGMGLLAALILALDGKAASVAVLETLVNVLSLLGLLLYLYRPQLLPARYKALWLVLAGFCCGWAILAKVPGLALAGALPLHALLMRRPKDALVLVAGTAGGALLGMLPFMIAAPSQLLRETFFFQMLRPQEVRAGIDQAARIAAYPESILTTALAAAGLALFALAIWRSKAAGDEGDSGLLQRLLVLPLWAIPVLAVFALGRSYHSPYMVQWTPPLALLGGLLATPALWRVAFARLAVPVGVCVNALALVITVPLLVSQWQATFFVAPDTVYRRAGALVQQATTEDDQVLAFDPGYAFVAGRPLVVLPDNQRLVDSAGHMTYYALGIDHRSWSDLLSDVLSFNKERNAPEIFQSTSSQASVLGGLWNARLAIVDGKIGLPQLRGQSNELIATMATSSQEVDHVQIYTLEPTRAGGHGFAGLLQLKAVTLQMLADSPTPTTLVPPTAGLSFVTQIEGTTGAVLQTGLYWQKPATGASGDADYRVVLRLDDAGGNKAQQTDRYPDEGAAQTSTWRRGMVYPDLENLPLPTAPGAYTLHIGLYDPNNGASYQEWQAPVVVNVH